MICRDLDVATKVARADGLDCITLEGFHFIIWISNFLRLVFNACQVILFSFVGDQVSKKGGMTGGFYDHRRSKLKFMNIIRQDTQSIGEKEQELERVKIKLQDILNLFAITILLKGI